MEYETLDDFIDDWVLIVAVVIKLIIAVVINGLITIGILIYLINKSYSSELSIKYQVNVANGSVADAKALGVSYTKDIWLLKNKYEIGHIFDNRLNNKDSLYAFIGLGIEPQVGPVFFNFFQSVGAISRKDSYLGGHFQFNEEFGLGVKGSDNTKIGVFYSHISNAGIQTPNVGKDFGGLKVTLPW